MELRGFGLGAADKNSGDYRWRAFVFLTVNEVELAHSAN